MGLFSGIGKLVGGLFGGDLFGSDNSKQSQTTTQQLDPRIAALLFGDGGNNGLFGDAKNLLTNSNTDARTAGFNPLQRYAMDNQVAGITGGLFNSGANASNAAASKLFKDLGVDWKAPDYKLPEFNMSQMYSPGYSGSTRVPANVQVVPTAPATPVEIIRSIPQPVQTEPTPGSYYSPEREKRRESRRRVFLDDHTGR